MYIYHTISINNMVLTSSAGHWFQSPSVAFPLATGFSFPTRRRDEVGRVGRSVGPPTAASGVLPGENYWFIARKIEMVYLCYVDFEVSISLSLSPSIAFRPNVPWILIHRTITLTNKERYNIISCIKDVIHHIYSYIIYGITAS